MSTISSMFKKSTDFGGQKTHSWQALEFCDGEFRDIDEFGRIHMLPTDKIAPNPNQPRRTFADESIIRLADSIRKYGILQPLTVRRLNIENARSKGTFEIIAGERRLRAAKLLGLDRVPCIMINADSRRSAELAIVENIHREDLNIFEQASAIASIIDMYGLTQEEIARQLSASQSFVANKLRILRLTEPEREKILKYALSERHARALLRISSISERLNIIEYIYTHNLNVASTEAYIDRYIFEKQHKCVEKTPRRMVLKDIRVFYNSVDRAISTIKQAGINVEAERVDEKDMTVLTIRIPNNVSRETL